MVRTGSRSIEPAIFSLYIFFPPHLLLAIGLGLVVFPPLHPASAQTASTMKNVNKIRRDKETWWVGLFTYCDDRNCLRGAEKERRIICILSTSQRHLVPRSRLYPGWGPLTQLSLDGTRKMEGQKRESRHALFLLFSCIKRAGQRGWTGSECLQTSALFSVLVTLERQQQLGCRDPNLSIRTTMNALPVSCSRRRKVSILVS